MFENYRFVINYVVNGKEYRDTSTCNSHYNLLFQKTAETIKFYIYPKIKLENIKVFFELDHQFDEDDKVFVNGYQSWTISKEMTKKDRKSVV